MQTTLDFRWKLFSIGENDLKIFNWWQWSETWKTSGKEFTSGGVAAAYIARTISFIYSTFQKLRLIV